MSTADALAKLNDYLRETNADEETFRAFNVIRNQYTKLIGQIMMMTSRTGPEIEED